MQIRRPSFALTAVALSAVLAGCGTVAQMAPEAKSRADAAVKAFDASAASSRAAVREIPTAAPDFRRTAAARIKGDVNVKAAAAPFAPILSEIGRQAGYSVAFAQNVDATRKVTVAFTDALAEDAIRTTAFLAGYVAVVDKNARTVMIADSGTYTYRLPASVFAQLQAKYDIGGNPSASAGGGGQQGGSGGAATALKSEFTVSGVEGTDPKGLTKFLGDIAGRNSEVYVSTTGHVSVKGDAQSLRRVTDFMKSFTKEAMTQVEIEASVVEVALNNNFALGIQWGEVINYADKGITGGMGVKGAVTGGNAAQTLLTAATTGGASGVVTQAGANAMAAGAGVSTFRVSSSSASLIDALAKFTDVNIVSQPKLLSLNNVPATFFDGTQLPYMGSVQQTASATEGGEPTVSGSVAFAIDGVSFSAVPSVVNNSTVQITLVPVLSNISRFDTFLGGLVTAPVQGNKQTYMRVLAESGKTLILGGIRYNREAKDTTLPSGVSRASSAKEVVILLRANVIEAPAFDPVVSESL